MSRRWPPPRRKQETEETTRTVPVPEPPKPPPIPRAPAAGYPGGGDSDDPWLLDGELVVALPPVCFWPPYGWRGPFGWGGRLGPHQYYKVTRDRGQLVLVPLRPVVGHLAVRRDPALSGGMVRHKLERRGISERDVADAIAWARRR